MKTKSKGTIRLFIIILLIAICPASIFSRNNKNVIPARAIERLNEANMRIMFYKNNTWFQGGSIAFNNSFRTENITIPEGIEKVKLIPSPMYKTHVDAIGLPTHAVISGNNKNLNLKAAKIDHDVFALEEDLILSSVRSGTMRINARAEVIPPNTANSFKYPIENRWTEITPDSKFYTYKLGSHSGSFQTT